MNSSDWIQTFYVPRPSTPRKAIVFGLASSVVVVTIIAVQVDKWKLAVFLEIGCILSLLWLIALNGQSLVYFVYRRNLRFHVGPEGLCLERGAVRQSVPWEAITRVEIRSEWGAIVGLDIYTANGREFELQDFECLAEIEDLVRAGIRSTVPVVEY